MNDYIGHIKVALPKDVADVPETDSTWVLVYTKNE